MAPDVRKRKERLAEYETLRAKQRIRRAKRKDEDDEDDWMDYDQYVGKMDIEKQYEEEGEEEKEGKEKRGGGEEGEETEREPEEVKEPIKTDITIPRYYSAETEDLVSGLIEDLLKDVDRSLVKKSGERIVHDILSGILRCSSMQDIVKEIVNNLPIELAEEKQAIVESAAEKILSLHEPQDSDENILPYVMEIIDETLDDVMCHDPHVFIPALVEKLLECLPSERISSEEVISKIALKVKDATKSSYVDAVKLKKSIEQIPPEDQSEAAEIINAILERVYGEGIDYLFVLK